MLDPFCRTHDVSNLFVVDASFFPVVGRRQSRSDDRRAGAARRRITSRRRSFAPARRTRERIMRVRSFSHVGITVSDFNRAVKFYWEVFGCPLVGVADTPPERDANVLRRRGGAPSCKIGWIRVPGGGVLEIFAFEPKQPAVSVPWNRVGLTHFSFNVRNLSRWYDYLQQKGVECVSRPERSPRGHSFFFVRGLRRQPDRVDGPRLHVPTCWLARPVGRVGCSGEGCTARTRSALTIRTGVTRSRNFSTGQTCRSLQWRRPIASPRQFC